MSWLQVALAEVGLLSACLGGGAVVASRLDLGVRELRLPVVLCMGMAVFGLAGLSVLLVGGVGRPGRASAMLVGLTIGGLVLSVWQRRVLVSQPRLLGVTVILLGLFSLRDWVYFTNDSFFLHYIVDLAIDRGGLPMEDYGGHFLGHPIWLHVAHFWANALGEPYIRWVFPVAYAVTTWVAIAAVKAEAVDGKWLLGGAVPFMLMGSYQMVIQGQMANHHMIVAMILLVAGVLLVRDTAQGAAVAAGVMLAGVPMMRMEGAMLVGLFVIGMAPALATPRRAVAVAGIPLALTLPWALYIAGQKSDGMLSVTQYLLNYLALVLAGGATVLLLRAKHSSLGSALLARWPRWCAFAAAALVACGALVSIENTVSNLRIVLQNMLFFARWGVFWDFALIVGVLLAGAGMMHQSMQESRFAPLMAVAGLIVGFIFFAGAFRHPYRYNWSDSATRMLVHVAPLVAVWLGERVMSMQRTIVVWSVRPGSNLPQRI